MDEEGFVRFLERQELAQNGINTRKNLANKIIEIIGKDLDDIVADDESMYNAIMVLQNIDNPAHKPRQNALRKYYAFKNGKEFPRIKTYENEREI